MCRLNSDHPVLRRSLAEIEREDRPSGLQRLQRVTHELRFPDERPFLCEEHRCEPQLLSFPLDRAEDARSCAWIRQRIADAYISWGTKEAHLHIAHKCCHLIDVLCYEDRFRLVVDAMPPQFIDTRYQRCPRSACRIRNTYVRPVAHLFDITVYGDLRHCDANIVRGEELSVPMGAKIEVHINLSEEVLVGINLKSHGHYTEQLGGNVNAPKPFNAPGILFFSSFKVFRAPVGGITDCARPRLHQIRPDLPPLPAVAQLLEQVEELLLRPHQLLFCCCPFHVLSFPGTFA